LSPNLAGNGLKHYGFEKAKQNNQQNYPKSFAVCG
jgi:hypothetical protein